MNAISVEPERHVLAEGPHERLARIACENEWIPTRSDIELLMKLRLEVKAGFYQP